MDDAKAALLFDTVPDWADPDDPDDRATLLAEEFADDGHLARAVRAGLFEVVANQIADDDPPAVWETAERLLATGIDRRQVLRNLVLAVTGQIQAILDENKHFDLEAYRAALDRLPLPTFEELTSVMVQIARERQPIDIEVLESMTMARLGHPMDGEPYESLLDAATDRIIGDAGPLEVLAGDLVVEPVSLCANVVLTHRLTEEEQGDDVLTVGTDMAGFLRLEDPVRTTDGTELHLDLLEDGNVGWHGPESWLRPFAIGSLLAVHLRDGAIAMEPLDREPAVDPHLVRRVRAAYDREIEEPGIPVSVEHIFLGMLALDRSLFVPPQAPLSALCEAAGLELRGDRAAHDEEIWENERRLHRSNRVVDRLEDPEDYRVALDVLQLFDEGTDEPLRLRRALAALEEPAVLMVVADEMLGFHDEADRADATAAFAERLLAAARRPGEVAVARWLSAVVAERRGAPLAALEHLQLAVQADGEWEPAVDRLAWYLSDRGQAADAARLWRRLGVGPEENEDLAIVEAFAAQPGPGAKLGRNEPCWCGSGRKFKACHLDRPAPVPLPDRVGWLYQKAAAYLQRRGGLPAIDLTELTEARAADGSEEALRSALEDPFVLDIALHELGWFERFLAERGPLLPEDEALLAASWTLVDRTVFEVVRTEPGEGVVVQDLRTGERLEVRERTFSREARPRMLICGRAVPDGDTYQFVGGLFLVPPGGEAALLELLDRGDGFELAEYLAALDRPPTMLTREGEPLVLCEATLDVPDADAARRMLDGRYWRDEGDEPDEWVEMHRLDVGDDIVRATIRLEGALLSVETMSAGRLERVLSVLVKGIEGATVVAESRQPFDPRARGGDMELPPRADALEEDPAIRAHLEALRDLLEVRWCDESIPALAGLTPRQAASDPTRREGLERLLASFEHPHRGRDDAGSMAMRPARLRELLGLEG